MNSLVDGVRGQLTMYCMEKAMAHFDRVAETSGKKTWRREFKAALEWLRVAMLFMDETWQQSLCDAFAEELKKCQ